MGQSKSLLSRSSFSISSESVSFQSFAAPLFALPSLSVPWMIDTCGLRKTVAVRLVPSLVGDELMKRALVSGKKGCETVVECAEIIEYLNPCILEERLHGGCSLSAHGDTPALSKPA